jgi:hypothetical protein
MERGFMKVSNKNCTGEPCKIVVTVESRDDAAALQTALEARGMNADSNILWNRNHVVEASGTLDQIDTLRRLVKTGEIQMKDLVTIPFPDPIFMDVQRQEPHAVL